MKETIIGSYISGENGFKNHIFLSVPDDEMQIAQQVYNSLENGCKVVFDKKDLAFLNNVFEKFSATDFFQKSLITSFVVPTLFLKKLQMAGKLKNVDNFFLQNNDANFSRFINGSAHGIAKNFDITAQAVDVLKIITDAGLLRVGIFIDGVDDQFLQRGLNNFLFNQGISFINIFATTKKLPTNEMTTTQKLVEGFDFFMGPNLTELKKQIQPFVKK